MSRYFTKTLASLEPYTPGEQLKIADIVKLNANENPYPPAPGVAAAVAAAVPGLRLYSDLTNGDLNAAIARHWGVRPENILCGNGSDENLLLALRAFCDESTPLAFADVTYSFYTVLCDLLHIPQHIIPLEADLTIDLKKYCGLHETIVIANPNAPTSLLAPVDAIEEVLLTYDNLATRIWCMVIDRLPRVDSHIVEHVTLLRAIADGDEERARQVAYDHVMSFEQLVRSVI